MQHTSNSVQNRDATGLRPFSGFSAVRSCNKKTQICKLSPMQCYLQESHLISYIYSVHNSSSLNLISLITGVNQKRFPGIVWIVMNWTTMVHYGEIVHRGGALQYY